MRFARLRGGREGAVVMLAEPRLGLFAAASDAGRGTSAIASSAHSRASGNPVPSQNACSGEDQRILRRNWVPTFVLRHAHIFKIDRSVARIGSGRRAFHSLAPRAIRAFTPVFDGLWRGWGEGASPRAQTRGSAPSPGRVLVFFIAEWPSPRTRGEELRARRQHQQEMCACRSAFAGTNWRGCLPTISSRPHSRAAPSRCTAAGVRNRVPSPAAAACAPCP
jgi:hypothetical protein